MRRIVNTSVNYIDYARSYIISNDFKPEGLWYSIDNEWVERWPNYEKPNFIQIHFKDDRLLVIDTLFTLNKLIEEFSHEGIAGFPFINWRKVAIKYAGIEIRNYQALVYSRRFEHSFADPLLLTTWDCSSGCIWDLSIIEGQKLIDPYKLTDRSNILRKED